MNILDKKDSKSNEILIMVKGLLVLLFLSHHISENVSDIFPFVYLRHIGGPVATVYFFVLGYELLSLYMDKEDFFRILTKKLLINFSLFLIFVLSYQIYLMTNGEEVKLSSLFLSFIYGGTYTTFPFAWYVVTYFIVNFYFLMTFRFLVKKPEWGVIIILAASIIHLQTLKLFHIPCLGWYINLIMLSFNIGILWKLFENNKIRSISAIACLLGMFILSIRIFQLGGTHILIPLAGIIILWIFINNDIPNLRFLLSTGFMCTEIFLVQGVLIPSLKGNREFLPSDYIFVIIVVILTFLFALPINYISRKILKSE